MIFAASIVYFDENHAEETEKIIASLPNVEIYDRDMNKGKMVIVIEAENSAGIEKAEEAIRKSDAVIDVAHYAFHFGEEVENILNGAAKPDVDFEEIFKKKHSK